MGALAIAVANNADAPLLRAAHPILVETGEEVLAGSTRMKAGTAQKIVLNLLSTLVMVRLGRVYRGLMVQMRATNAKLRRRAALMVAEITGCGEGAATDAVSRADGDVKIASLMALGVDRVTAETVLDPQRRPTFAAPSRNSAAGIDSRRRAPGSALQEDVGRHHLVIGQGPALRRQGRDHPRVLGPNAADESQSSLPKGGSGCPWARSVASAPARFADPAEAGVPHDGRRAVRTGRARRGRAAIPPGRAAVPWC